jgi:hypothetical protein
MTMLGWSAFGSLILELSSQSNTLHEALSYTNMGIALCGAVAALIVLAGSSANRTEGSGAARTESLNDAAENFRALATQVRCAESRARLLALAERLD